ncbi:MAG: von Willebrand factor type A domain-containing protein [Bacteroidota bacterium]
MRNAITLILLGLLCPLLSFGTTIQGKVTDKNSGESLPFANVHLLKDGASVLGTTTDFDGNYVLTGFDAGTYTLKVVYVGYTDQEISGVTVIDGQIVSVNIELSPGETLTEITVVEYREPLISLDMTTSGSTITRSDISALPGVSRTSPSRSRGSKAGKNKMAKRSISSVTSTAAGVREANNKSTVIIDGIPASYGDVSGGIVDIAEKEKKRKKKLSKEKPPQNWNTEDYAPITENQFKEVTKEPLSTFSIDVDRAAYSNIRRMINNNNKPVANAVRIEEMINYFDYNYPQPQGDHPFEIITEVSDCPWNKDHQLVHIGLQGEKLEMEDAAPNNLVFLIDVSGSMAPANKLPLLKSAFKLLINNLRPEDKVAIVVYAGAAGLVLPPTSGGDKDKILNALDGLQSGGSTAGGAGIKLAYKTARENFIKRGNNRVILATDGDFNVGVSSDADLLELIEQERESDVFLTVLGFGMYNFKDNKMELLADKGNGNYAYIDNIREAKKMLVTEVGGTLYTIAKDVKLQIEFNPAYVSAFRLIGYENRVLEHEDFNDDKKDAGELGAGHTVTALYEIIPRGKRTKGSVKPIDDLKYQSLEETEKAAATKEMMNVKFRYKQPTGTKSKLITHPVGLAYKEIAETSDNFRFSAAVAGFGLLLRDSEFKGNLTYEKVIDLAQGAMGNDEYGYRAEFVSLVEASGLLFMAER